MQLYWISTAIKYLNVLKSFYEILPFWLFPNSKRKQKTCFHSAKSTAELAEDLPLVLPLI